VRYARNLNESMNVLFDIRDTNNPDYQTGGLGPVDDHRPGVVFRSIESLLTSESEGALLFQNTTELIFGKITGFGGLDQRDRENNYLDDLDNAINTFQANMKAVPSGSGT